MAKMPQDDKYILWSKLIDSVKNVEILVLGCQKEADISEVTAIMIDGRSPKILFSCLDSQKDLNDMKAF